LLILAPVILFIYGLAHLANRWPIVTESIVYTSPSPTPFVIPDYSSDIEVPFIVQAPPNQWKDARYQDACEEATSLMAVSWGRHQSLTPQIANDIIAQISSFQQEKYGEFRDTSAKDTLERIINGYFHYMKAIYIKDASLDDIIQTVYQGKLVIAPMNGRALNNPYFTQPGPERHMVLIRGFDPITKEFITNDPGIGKGEKYRYPQNILYSAIRDYSTGYHIPITKTEKNIIVISSE
jgi:hypothetical protein